MRLFIVMLLQVLLFLPFTGFAAQNGPAPLQKTKKVSEIQKARVMNSYGRLPLYFIENRGQVDGQVRFFEKGSGHSTFFTSDGVVLSLTKRENASNKTSFDGLIKGITGGGPLKVTTEAVSLSFVGANEKARIVAGKKQGGHVNYFVGNDKTKWHSNIPTYGTVTYKDVYRNIDIQFYGNNKNMEHDVIVRPGGDISEAVFAYRGIKGLKVTETGDLEVSLNNGNIIEKKPYIYQMVVLT